MMLTTLADIARSAGLRVVEQPGWRTRGHGQMSGVRAVVCHHTAGPRTGNAPSLGVVQNGRSDLAGPLAHYVLGRDGTVYVVAAGLCWHAGAVLNNDWSNNYSVGIEAEATGVDGWPDVQLDAYARLCRALCTAFGLPVSAVLGHKEVCSPRGRKTDPNFDMGAFRAHVAAVGTAPTPPQEEDDMFSDTDRAVLNRLGALFPAIDAAAIAKRNGHNAGSLTNAVHSAWEELIFTTTPAVSALAAALAEATKNPDITVDTIRQIVNDAVAQNVRITGTVEVTGAGSGAAQ